MTAAIVIERLEKFVRDNFLYARPDYVLEPSSALIGTGVVDSMGIMELVAFLDEEFGVIVEDADITEANLRTLATIAGFVMRRLESSAPVEPARVVYEIAL